MKPKNGPISYQLLIHLKAPIRLDIGALGRHHLPAGFYLYTGSARRNIEARVARHRRKRKPRRWHIDYLTCHRNARVVETWLSDRPECQLNQSVAGEVVVARFGASDCRSGCGAHLKYLGLEDPRGGADE